MWCFVCFALLQHLPVQTRLCVGSVGSLGCMFCDMRSRHCPTQARSGSGAAVRRQKVWPADRDPQVSRTLVPGPLHRWCLGHVGCVLTDMRWWHAVAHTGERAAAPRRFSLPEFNRQSQMQHAMLPGYAQGWNLWLCRMCCGNVQRHPRCCTV